MSDCVSALSVVLPDYGSPYSFNDCICGMQR